ncbi:MAG: hypothetical protein GWO81_00655 [Verrucomicrobia bacterium]|nr:hypothetical protein [Verrucomicrobiota bacterium]
MEIPETEPTEESAEKSLCLLPGHLFFVEGIALPEGLTEEEIPSFAELSLEAIAPFPIEQLNWGYLCDTEHQQLLYFATHQDRLRQAGFKDLEAYTWVLPDFLALHGLNPGSETCQLQTPQSEAKVHFRDSPRVPQTVTATPRDAAAESSDAYQLQTATVNEAQGVCFTLTAPASETSREVTLAAETLWAADVRPADFKTNERRARKLSAHLLQGFKYAACFAGLLIAVELILLSCNLWLNIRENKVERQSTPVATIQEQQALSVKLERVFENQLRPVAVLELINNLRPTKSIHFSETSTEENNHITIEGEANTVNALNNYIDQLKASGQLALLSPPKTLTRSGKTTFSVELSYTHRETPKPRPTEPAQAPKREPAPSS